MIVLTIIFSTLFKRNIANFPVYYLIGMLTYQFFAGGTKAAILSIVSNAYILKTIYIPKYLYSLLSNTVKFCYVLIIFNHLFMVMAVTDVNFTMYIILQVYQSLHYSC